MNRDELRVALTKKRVNESLYSIDKLADQSESYSVVRDGDKWKVVYKERGGFIDIEIGLAEDDACDLVYRMFADAFCWTD